VSGVQILVRHDAELDAYAYFQRISERNPEVGLIPSGDRRDC
jgi:hypothetical protein